MAAAGARPGDWLAGRLCHRHRRPRGRWVLALDRLDKATIGVELQYLGDGSAALELWPFIAYLYAQHGLHSGHAQDASSRLDQVQEGHDEADQARRGAAAALLGRARADLLIACGRGQKAEQLVRGQGAGKPWSRVPATRIRLLSGHGSAPRRLTR